MRLLIPGLKIRRPLVAELSEFFRYEKPARLRSAARQLAAFYRLPVPDIRMVECWTDRRLKGETLENGRIYLMAPRAWKLRRVEHTEREWLAVALHEMAHYVLWADAERKADRWAALWLTGL